MIYLDNTTDIQEIFIPRKMMEPEYAPFNSKPLEIDIDTVNVQDNLMTYSRSIKPEKDTDSYSAVTVSMEIPMSEEKLTNNGVFSFNMPVGTVQVEVNNEAAYNQGYGKGYDAGVTTGRNEGYKTGVEDTKNNAEDIYITENGVYEGKLYKKIEVAVPKLINVQDFEISFGSSIFKKIPEWFDFTGRMYLTQLFNSCIELTDIEQSTFTNLSPIKIDYMFYNCVKLEDLTPIAGWDTSNVTDMSGMFSYCTELKDLTPIAGWDTSNVTNMKEIFNYCSNLHTVPALRGDKVINDGISFGYSTLTKLANYGGLINLKYSQNGEYYLKQAPNLTYESCINILKGLYDFVGNSETPLSTQGKLKVHQNFINLVGSQISIATDKGWTITT